MDGTHDSSLRQFGVLCVVLLLTSVSAGLVVAGTAGARAAGPGTPVADGSAAAQTATTVPSPSTTPTCCMLTGDLQTTCAFDPGTGLYTIGYTADIVNSCGGTMTVSANFYLEVSTDGVNFGFIQRSSIQNYVFQPGHNFITETFFPQSIPPEDHYYRVRMQLYACGIYEIYSPASPLCGPPTPTLTPIPTDTPIPTPTSAPTPILVGHVTWQGRSAQPMPITLTLKMGATEVNYPTELTDQYGFFTVTVGGLPNGIYNWRADAILLKPGSLTDEEWVIMRRHPVYAYELLSPIAFLRPALDIPHYHHEKWDGTGYPHGLKGEQIPLAARIFAVVDVWDALRSDRPYRDAWPEEKVREHIRLLSGTHFDPKVVEAFMAMGPEDLARSDKPSIVVRQLEERRLGTTTQRRKAKLA